MDQQPAIAIVDAYSSGSLFAPKIHELGLKAIHIQSTPIIPKSFVNSFRPDDFSTNIIHRSIAKTVATLHNIAPLAIVAGAETGVLLSDQLTEKLGLNSNGSAKSLARRNKFLMIETLREAGLQTCQQIQTGSYSNLSQWVQKCDFPVVLKPLESAGTEDVYFCYEPKQVETAFSQIIGKENQLGLMNEVVLAQTYLDGPEYVVDTVSCCGRHIVTDVWVYSKIERNGRERIYDSTTLLDHREARYAPLIDYFLAVLDAVGIRHGAAHGELIWTKSGPVLVEIGARCVGASVPKLVTICTGYSQIEATLDAIINPLLFFRRAKDLFPQKYGKIVWLISDIAGPLRTDLSARKFEKLSSFQDSSLALRQGYQLNQTVDLFTCPGTVFLAHEDPDIIERDYQAIREIEEAGFYASAVG